MAASIANLRVSNDPIGSGLNVAEPLATKILPQVAASTKNKIKPSGSLQTLYPVQKENMPNGTMPPKNSGCNAYIPISHISQSA